MSELGLYDLRRDLNTTKQIWAKWNYEMQVSFNERETRAGLENGYNLYSGRKHHFIQL
jgi:hypothetical protein